MCKIKIPSDEKKFLISLRCSDGIVLMKILRVRNFVSQVLLNLFLKSASVLGLEIFGSSPTGILIF
jgi:hypothetical protein